MEKDQDTMIDLKDAKFFCIPYAGPFGMDEERKAIVRVKDIKKAEDLIQQLIRELEALNERSMQ